MPLVAPVMTTRLPLTPVQWLSIVATLAQR
jgi:hypothetical protein